MFDKKETQRQTAADGSLAIQAAGDVLLVRTGLSYTEAKEVALDVFRSNFMQLVGVAREAAAERAEEITDQFLKRLEEENSAGIEQAKSPDFQHSIFAMQKEYARSADKDLAKLLVELLVDRTRQPQRNILQIVLNESIEVAGKLTSSELAALSVVFFLRDCETLGVLSDAALGEQLDKYILPFIRLLPTHSVSYRHLQFAGCGAVDITTLALHEAFWLRYQGLFNRGFDPDRLSGCAFFFNPTQNIVGPSRFDPALKVILAQNTAHLEHLITSNRVVPSDAIRLREAFTEQRPTADDIRGRCEQIRPYLKELFDLWATTNISNFKLTSVGVALGHANIKSLPQEIADLSTWIK